MKLLMTADTVGGVFNYAIDLLRGLHNKGFRICLITMGPSPTTDQWEEIHRSSFAEHHHLVGKLEWMEDPWHDLQRVGTEIQRCIYRSEPDLIHFNHYAHIAVERNCPAIVVAHSCVISWFGAVHGLWPDRLGRYYEMMRKNLKHADEVVAPTGSFLKEFEKLYGPFKRSRAIYNASGGFSCERRKKENSIFSMGRFWDEGKNIRSLVNAAPLIKAPIVIAGDMPHAIGLPSNVTSLGKLSRTEVSDQLHKAAIYALPVKYEPFGLSFLEAAHSGCALIGGDLPTLREIWGESMLYVDPADPNALADACNELLEDPTLREEMSKKAEERVSRYHINDQVSQYTELYRSLIDKEMEPRPIRTFA